MSNKWAEFRRDMEMGRPVFQKATIRELLAERDSWQLIAESAGRHAARQQRTIEVMRRHCVDTTLLRVERILKGEEP